MAVMTVTKENFQEEVMQAGCPVLLDFWAKPRLQASKRVVSLAKLSRGQKKIMNQNMKAFIRYLIVAICSAIVTFLSSSCTAGLVIGKNQRQHQENNISTKVDSTYYVPTITIR